MPEQAGEGSIEGMWSRCIRRLTVLVAAFATLLGMPLGQAPATDATWTTASVSASKASCDPAGVSPAESVEEELEEENDSKPQFFAGRFACCPTNEAPTGLVARDGSGGLTGCGRQLLAIRGPPSA